MGKGGVGRTRVATTLGLAAARMGKRVMVAEVAQQERMSRAFRREGVGYSETELAEHFYAMSVDPQRALGESLAGQTPGPLSGAGLHTRRCECLVAAAPRVSEVTPRRKVWELAQLDRKYGSGSRYDRVLLDAPASGPGLALLHAPGTFGE